MFSELNASTYKYSSAYYNAEFEYILSKIIACYYLILKEKTLIICYYFIGKNARM